MQPSPYLNFYNSNRASGFSYDNAGNLLSDGSNNYLYDAENRVCAVQQLAPLSGTFGYLYAANGPLLGLGNITSFTCDLTKNGMLTANGLALTNAYMAGPQGERLIETNGSFSFLHYNVFWEGKLLGTFAGTTAVQTNWHFALNDWLGTKRVTTTSTGTAWTSTLSGPFGDFQSQTGPGSDPSEEHFTGKERDTESGNDYFGARYYSSAMGRFMSPDWSQDPDEVPYADLENPQTLNLYAYVQNNPLSRTDPFGHATDPCAGIPNCVSVTADPPPSIPLFSIVIGVGHHFIPQAIWQGLDKATRSWQVLNKLTTRALKSPKLSNPYDKLHRGVNKQTRELVEKLERDTGRSVKDFEKGDWEKLEGELERAGGDVDAFNARLANLEPEARTLGEAMAETLEELFPAAADAAVTTGEAAGAAAEGAAESGAVIP